MRVLPVRAEVVPAALAGRGVVPWSGAGVGRRVVVVGGHLGLGEWWRVEGGFAGAPAAAEEEPG